METRIAKLEEFSEDAKQRTVRLENNFSGLQEQFNALRVEMHKGFADVIKWIIGTVIVSSATGITVITFVLNNATPKAPPPAAPPPVVIYTQPAPPPQPKM
jgi:hypothetical protein